ncbi:MAG: ABC transporter substrate-binding protein [Oscillospiraceae bacterium]
MKHTKISALALALIMLLSLFSGCTAEKPETAKPVNVTDMMGRECALDAPATKIVALTAADCEILYAIGGGDALVGRGSYCQFPAEALAAPEVQSGSETNLEQIIALKPQVVLMSTMAQTEEQVAALEKAGIRVVVSNAADIEGVYKSIGIIGAVTGKDKEAAALVSDMKKSFAELSAKVATKEEKTVYFEVSPLEYGLWTAGKNTFMDEIANMLGLKNAFADIEGWAEISEEQVLSRNPDYIVTITAAMEGAPSPVAEILARKGWEGLNAVKNSAVFNADTNEISVPGPRLVNAAQALYSFVYGA